MLPPSLPLLPSVSGSFFFNDTATTEIYTLSLHDALPISRNADLLAKIGQCQDIILSRRFQLLDGEDRKSTRLNSSHPSISYAVFCLKKTTNCESEKQKAEETIPTDTTHTTIMLSVAGAIATVIMVVAWIIVEIAAFFFFFLKLGAPPGIPPFPAPCLVPT